MQHHGAGTDQYCVARRRRAAGRLSDHDSCRVLAESADRRTQYAGYRLSRCDHGICVRRSDHVFRTKCRITRRVRRWIHKSTKFPLQWPSAAPLAGRGRDVTLLFRLFVLVAVALLPAIAIQAYNEFDLRRARQVEVRDQALSLARLVASDQQQIVQGIRQVLIALSELQSIKTRNRDACNSYLGAMQRRFPEFLSFLATDLDGRSFCDNNGGRSPVDASGRAYFANVVQTGAFAVGEFSIGLLSHRRVIQFALPFYGDDGRMGGVIVSSLSLDWLADYIARDGAPAGAAIAVTDRNGTYLARYPDNGRFAGRKMPAGAYVNTEQGATADVRDLDGVERIVGFSALGADSGGLLVSFGFDKAQVFTEIQARTQRGIVLIILSTSVVLILTWLGARRFIHRPLGQLIDAANQWRLGDYAPRVRLRERSEIGRVADAFDTMADALERREHQLSEAKEKAEEAAARIITIFESTTDSVVILDPNWRIRYLNARARAEVADGRELVGMTVWDACREPNASEIFSGLREAMSTRRPVSVETF